MRVQEMIVVEGKDDSVAIKRAVDADTIETNGSAINEEIITRIRLAQETRGVIVFTDPDFPGEKIRQTIQEKIPACAHAFLPKEKARAKSGKGLGVEHASPEAIREALRGAHFTVERPKEQIQKIELLENGLIGTPNSREKREKLGKILKIGYTNGKQLYHRLMQFDITKEQLVKALNEID